MTVSHARHISLALLVFMQSFGKFPDAGTAEIIAKKSKHAPDFDLASSDGYFSQIIAEDLVSHDGIFYANTAFTIKPNRWFSKHNTTLIPGEVGYGYLLKGKDVFTNAGNPYWTPEQTPFGEPIPPPSSSPHSPHADPPIRKASGSRIPPPHFHEISPLLHWHFTGMRSNPSHDSRAAR